MPTATTEIRRPALAGQNGSARKTEAFITYEEKRADELSLDKRVNRTLDTGWVNWLVTNMDLDSIRVLSVGEIGTSRGPKWIVIDGQHRINALMQLGMGEWPVVCEVYHGLTIAEMAAKFRTLNKQRPPTAIDDFLIGINAKDEEILAINKIVNDAGLVVSRGHGDGLITCVDKLKKIHRQMNGEVLALTLETALSAWGRTAPACEGHVIGGIGEFYKHAYKSLDEHEVEPEHLIKKLAKFPGGAMGLVGKAKGWRDIRPGFTVTKAFGSVMVDLYNRGRKDANKLPQI